MTIEPQFMPPALSTAEIRSRQLALAESSGPTTFKLSAQMLDQGRTDTPLAATEDLTLRLKIYASGGENELHSHSYEDHAFVILQGSARFFGPEGELIELDANQGIMLPRGNFYRFYATSDEPLVMLRVGTPNYTKQPADERVGREGDPLKGDSPENKSQPVIFRDGVYFG